MVIGPTPAPCWCRKPQWIARTRWESNTPQDPSSQVSSLDDIFGTHKCDVSCWRLTRDYPSPVHVECPAALAKADLLSIARRFGMPGQSASCCHLGTPAGRVRWLDWGGRSRDCAPGLPATLRSPFTAGLGSASPATTRSRQSPRRLVARSAVQGNVGPRGPLIGQGS